MVSVSYESAQDKDRKYEIDEKKFGLLTILQMTDAIRNLAIALFKIWKHYATKSTVFKINYNEKN